MRITASPEALRRAYEATEEDPAWSASRRLIEQGKPPSEMFRSLAVRPDILAALSGFGAAVYPGGTLERALKERVIVAVSQQNGCQYCAASHGGTLARLNLGEAAETDRERIALEYARAAVADSNAVPDELFARLREQFSDEEIVELTMLVGLSVMLNIYNNCLQNVYNDDYGRLSADVQ